MEKVVILISVLLFSIASIVSGQQSHNIPSILEDVTFVDINGEPHRPYDYLEEGKIVIIDVFATWCGPCWDFHESGHLQNIYETYGPDGSDQLMVFYVEGDLNTGTEQLSGYGSNTLGNYVDCSPYPLIEDHRFTFDNGILNFPTLLFICPDKEIQEIGQLAFEQMEELINNRCPAPTSPNNLDLLYFTNDSDPACGTLDFIPTVIIQNNGSNSISHVGLQFKVDNEIVEDSLGFDVFLNPYETTSLPFPLTTIDGTTEFGVEILSVNQTEDSENLSDTISFSKPFLFALEGDDLELQIQTDNFGYEIYWKIEDDNGTIIDSGGNAFVMAGAQQNYEYLLQAPEYYESDELYHEFIALEEFGCYTFTIIDDYGDGLCCPGSAVPGFRITDASGNEVIKNVAYLDEYSVSFEYNVLPTSTQEELNLSNQKVYPNPAAEILNIDFYSQESGTGNFNIINSLGQTISTFDHHFISGSNSVQIDVKQFPSGAYFLFGSLQAQKINVPFQIIH